MSVLSLPTMPVGCDRFVVDTDPAIAYRVAHDTFPVLTDPEFVPADRAHFMRADDWVVGLRAGERVRCYPAHMLDNVHVVNDTIDGRSYAVMHCEICCSNAVFLATLDGRRVTFGTGGLFGGTLSVFDEQTRSLWSHGMGVAFDGPLAGRSLVRVESFQASYAEWLALYPETEVMVWPRPAEHPDCRHGHGTDAWFAQPGIETLVLRTMAVRSDPRLPENEMVVSVFTPGGHAALPLRELAAAGSLLAFNVGDLELVILGGGPDSALTGTFHTHLLDQPEFPVRLASREGQFVDAASGSVFRVDGLAVSGALAGQRLQPLATMTNKWHSLICFLPGIPVIRGSGSTPLDEGPLAPVFDGLRTDGFTVDPIRRLFALELPHGACAGYDLRLNGQPFQVLLFEDTSIAQDQLLWTTHALQAGEIVLAATPPLYTDWTNTKRYHASAIAWPSLVDEPALRASLIRTAVQRMPQDLPLAPQPTSLTAFAAGLRARGVGLVVRRAAYRETLPVGARTGMVADIDGDPFIVWRFESAAAAAEHTPLREHSIVAGHLVLQSDPPDIYAHRERGTGRRPDAQVSWSRLLASESFVAAVLAAARGGQEQEPA